MRRWITISMSGMMMPDVNEFERNITVEDRQQGICGNGAGNGVIGDAILLSNYIGYLRILAEPYHNEVIWKNCEKNHNTNSDASKSPTVRDDASTCLRDLYQQLTGCRLGIQSLWVF